MQALINFLARFINATKDAFNVQLSGSNVEQASAQDTQVATTAKTYTKAEQAKWKSIVKQGISVYAQTVRLALQPLANLLPQDLALVGKQTRFLFTLYRNR